MMQKLIILFSLSVISATILKSSSESSPNTRILNGQQAQLGQFPWQVGILSLTSSLNETFLCGGSIISDEWILTTAHCITGTAYSIIYSGTIDLNDRGRTLSIAETYIVHENYSVNWGHYGYDVGLLKLDAPLVFDEYTKPIALAEEELEAGVDVTISGFGHTTGEYGNDTNTLLNYIVAPTMNNSECSRYLDIGQSPGVICTFFNIGSDSTIINPCVGDSGSPVVLNADTNPVHVALFSFMSSFGCNFTYPTVHTRTSTYREWIRKTSGV